MLNGMWRSLVAHLVWDQRAAGSNPVIPTTSKQSSLCFDFFMQKIIRPLPCFSFFPQKQAFAGALKSNTVRCCSIFLFRKDSNLEKARAVKKNSPVDCFLSEWCAGGYRSLWLGSPSRQDAKRLYPVIPTTSKQSSLCFDFFMQKIIRPLPCFSFFPQKQAFAGALKSNTVRCCSIFLLDRIRTLRRHER